jgi:hypothetical protein
MSGLAKIRRMDPMSGQARLGTSYRDRRDRRLLHELPHCQVSETAAGTASPKQTAERRPLLTCRARSNEQT